MNIFEISDAYLNHTCHLERLHQFIHPHPLASEHLFWGTPLWSSQKTVPCAFC